MAQRQGSQGDPSYCTWLLHHLRSPRGFFYASHLEPGKPGIKLNDYEGVVGSARFGSVTPLEAGVLAGEERLIEKPKVVFTYDDFSRRRCH